MLQGNRPGAKIDDSRSRAPHGTTGVRNNCCFQGPNVPSTSICAVTLKGSPPRPDGYAVKCSPSSAGFGLSPLVSVSVYVPVVPVGSAGQVCS